MTTLRRATVSDRAGVTATLADAFAHDPMFQWVAGAGPNESMEPKLRRFFGALVKLVLAHDDHLVFTTEDGAGAAVWHAPNAWKLSSTDTLRALPAMLRSFTTRTPRMLGAFSASGQILVTNRVHGALEDRVEGTSLGTMDFKGLSPPVPVFEIADLR